MKTRATNSSFVLFGVVFFEIPLEIDTCHYVVWRPHRVKSNEYVQASRKIQTVIIVPKLPLTLLASQEKPGVCSSRESCDREFRGSRRTTGTSCCLLGDK